MHAKIIKKVKTELKLINKIICILKKGEYIILDSGKNIITKSLTMLASVKNSSRQEIFLNDYDLAIYIAKVSSIKTLMGTWVFMIVSQLQN